MLNYKLEKLINSYLGNEKIEDYSPNGLQVEGCSEVKKIITGVTACQELIEKAINLKAQAIIVHHGFFWKNESPIINSYKRKRLKSILTNDINLYSWHLPLDLHDIIGNNYCLSKILKIKIIKKINKFLLLGQLEKPLTVKNFTKIISLKLKRKPFVFSSKKSVKYINNIALCTGNGQNFINSIYNYKVDAFLTGEVSEQTIHYVEENNIHFFAAGHHATEIFGVLELGNWLKKKYCFDVSFININNPI